MTNHHDLLLMMLVIRNERVKDYQYTMKHKDEQQF